jgi:tRNA(fMet)-specific endonuclease VapC
LNDTDIFIASIAMASNFTVVTHNIKNFSKIPNLKIIDWMTESMV